MASEAELFFNFMFALLAYVFVYPPQEFVLIGLSAEQLATRFNLLPAATLSFVEHHTRRTALNAVLHSALPALYLTLYDWHFPGAEHFTHGRSAAVASLWTLAVAAAWTLVAGAATVAAYRLYTNRHPLHAELRKYANEAARQSWRSVASSVDDEYRRLEKTVARVSTLTTVVATENWVIKTTPYAVRVAHQSDTTLVVVKSDTHAIAVDSGTSDSVQYVNITVRPTRAGVRPFDIRLNALHFAELQDRINRPIAILSGVNFSRSVLDRFVDAFRECVAANPVYTTDQDLADSCFACMQARPNVKLQRHCADIDPVTGAPLPADRLCGQCFCRPMWCLDCLAKWFASRQDAEAREQWLEQKCSCPMCRARFCLSDVCGVEVVNAV